MDERADAETLRCGVRERYRDVALNRDGRIGSYTGRPLAAKLGYPVAIVDAMPDRAVESFAGVSNPFSLRELKRGERVVDVGSCAGGSPWPRSWPRWCCWSVWASQPGRSCCSRRGSWP